MRDKPFVPQRIEGYRERVDNAAVEVLSMNMKAKLAGQRSKGYRGWNNDCTQQHLSDLLRQSVDKGDPVDVANFCAFLLACGETIAPQAQADTRDADQKRWMEIGKAIERACIDQPESTEIVISLERDAGTVTMFDPDGNEHDQFSHGDGLAGVVNEAIDAAIAAAKGE